MVATDLRPAQLSRRSIAERGWLRPTAELGGLIVGCALFSWLHNLAGRDVASATANARSLQSVERTLHIDIEVAANRWLTHHPVLMQTAVVYYRLYYLPLVGVVLWVLILHTAVYPTVRRTIVVMASLALLVFWLLPMSPPRFALPGIVDVVADHDLFAGTGSRDVTNGQNHLSAMPSLHVGWSALAAYALWSSFRGRRRGVALLVWLLPIVMVAVVITTGNHYVLDVAGSAVVLVVSAAAAAGWDRWRRSRHVESKSYDSTTD